MNTSNADLEYEKYISFYRDLGHLNGDAQHDKYWHHQAQKWHNLCVIDATGKIQIDMATMGGKLEMGDAYNHLVLGAARRAKMIWSAARQLNGLIPPDRIKPLPIEDAFDAADALNQIYIHTKGILDNYAWAIFHKYGREEAKDLRPVQIDLFHKKFRSKSSLSDFSEVTAPYDKWIKDLKIKRDPVAHRIPLSVPPALLDKNDQEIHAEISKRYQKSLTRFFTLAETSAPESVVNAASAEVNALSEQLQNIGKFAPIIMHDPKEASIPIYPTVPEDIGMLVKLMRALNNKINEMIST